MDNRIGPPKEVMPRNATLAERISQSANGSAVLSGRGHGRKTPHGRGPSRKVQRSRKQDMLYFVRDIVRALREQPPRELEHNNGMSTHDIATHLVNDIQYFDCSMIEEYVGTNVSEAYPDSDVPPHPDVILPAENVGLYFAGDGSTKETLYVCEAAWHLHGDEYRGRTFNVSFLIVEDGMFKQRPLGVITSHEDDCTFDMHAMHIGADYGLRRNVEFGMRFVALALQTINQPRFVIPSKRDVSMVKRQAFRKATGRFTPDSWNLVSWNVDKPVKAKPYEEGGGGKQALHFRRGHWRKAKEDWERSRWSETRNRWEIYVHGYEAGHPAFGVKKSYHMPRKEAS